MCQYKLFQKGKITTIEGHGNWSMLARDGWGGTKQKAPQKSQGLALKSNLNISGLRLNPLLGVPGYLWAPWHSWRSFVTEVRLLGGGQAVRVLSVAR